MHHDEPSDDHTSRDRAWSDRGSDGEHSSGNGDARELASIASAEVESSIEDGDQGDQGSEGFQLALSHRGPLPDPATLNGYDQLVPGTARRMIEQHLYGEKVTSDAIRRLTKAEGFAVVTGAVGAQILTIGGLAAAVTLIVLGFPAASIAAIIPAIIGASAQVVAARRGSKAEENSEGQ